MLPKMLPMLMHGPIALLNMLHGPMNAAESVIAADITADSDAWAH
jgi:hypothetical protein